MLAGRLPCSPVRVVVQVRPPNRVPEYTFSRHRGGNGDPRLSFPGYNFASRGGTMPDSENTSVFTDAPEPRTSLTPSQPSADPAETTGSDTTDVRPAAAAALPLVLRHHAGDMEASASNDRTGRVRQARASRSSLLAGLPGGTSDSGACHRHRCAVFCNFPPVAHDRVRVARLSQVAETTSFG